VQGLGSAWQYVEASALDRLGYGVEKSPGGSAAFGEFGVARTPPFFDDSWDRRSWDHAGRQGSDDQVIRPHVGQPGRLVPCYPLILQTAKIAETTDCALNKSGQVAFDESGVPAGDRNLAAER
jgi:hypothetical protein